MSEELVASLGVMSASQCLNNIDAENLAPGVCASIVKYSGPFGVFSLAQDVNKEDLEVSPLADETSDHSSSVSETFVPSTGYDDTRSFDINDSLDASGLLDLTSWGDITEVPGMDIGANTCPAEEISAELITQMGDSFYDIHTQFTVPWLGGDTTFPLSPPSPQLSRELSAMSIDVVPRDAPLLLSHYMENVIPLLSPILHRKNNPWDILHLKSAMQTLSQLSMRVACNYAQLTIFCAILATSCFHRASSSDGDMAGKWARSAKDYFTNALEFLKLSLKNEVNQAQPKKAKYKEILTSILAVVNVGVRPLSEQKICSPCRAMADSNRYSTRTLTTLARYYWMLRGSFAFAVFPKQGGREKSGFFIIAMLSRASSMKVSLQSLAMRLPPIVI